MGDRFYGSPDLIAWCRARGWDWRLRLKRDLLVFEGGGETTLAACFARGEHLLSGVELTGKRVATNVAMVHEPGHPEPWIIALSEPPTVHRAFDYGLRWGIEAMFSDFKTRGFGLEDSQIRRPERLDRLLLVMALALHWAVSTGMWEAAHHAPRPPKKSPGPPDPGSWRRGRTSLFRRGLRRIQRLLQRLVPLAAPLERLAELMGGKVWRR